MERYSRVALIAALSGAAIPVLAPAQGVDPAMPGKPACPSLSDSPTSGAAPPSSTAGQTQSKGSLSDQLARSDGVICPPPHVDPDIKKSAPNTGRMPVIPPPGTENPAIRPK